MIFGWKLDEGWSILITLPFLLTIISFFACIRFRGLSEWIADAFDVFGSATLIVLLVNLTILGLIHLLRAREIGFSFKED